MHRYSSRYPNLDFATFQYCTRWKKIHNHGFLHNRIPSLIIAVGFYPQKKKLTFIVTNGTLGFGYRREIEAEKKKTTTFPRRLYRSSRCVNFVFHFPYPQRNSNVCHIAFANDLRGKNVGLLSTHMFLR